MTLFRKASARSALARLTVPLWCGAVAAASCNPVCDTRDDEAAVVVFKGGRVDATKTFYETSAFDEAYLDFPPGRRYALEHGLIDKPRRIGIFVAFHPDPLNQDNNVAPAAGNQAVIEKVDAQVVWVRNDTCADLYLRVELGAVTTLSDADTNSENDSGDPSDAGPDAD